MSCIGLLHDDTCECTREAALRKLRAAEARIAKLGHEKEILTRCLKSMQDAAIDMAKQLEASPATQAEQWLCPCGHPQSAHIYETGACRPGYECAFKCERFGAELSRQDNNKPQAGSAVSNGVPGIAAGEVSLREASPVTTTCGPHCYIGANGMAHGEPCSLRTQQVTYQCFVDGCSNRVPSERTACDECVEVEESLSHEDNSDGK